MKKEQIEKQIVYEVCNWFVKKHVNHSLKHPKIFSITPVITVA